MMRRTSLRIHAPLLPVTVALMAGIVAGEWVADWTSGFLLLLPLLFVTLCLRRYPKCQTAGICGSVLVLGVMLSSRHSAALDVGWPRQVVNSTVVVMSEPTERDKYVMFDALIAGTDRKIKCRVARDEHSEQIRIGDGLTIRSKIQQPHQWQEGHFDYQRYMRCHNYVGETFVGHRRWQWTVVPLSDLSLSDRLRLRALCLRHSLLEQFRQWRFDDEEYGVIAAMTLGEKSQLDRTLKNTYSQVGAAHVLALSGLHLMIVYSVLTLLTGWWRFRVLSQVLVVLSVWAFAFLTGLSPSVVRSAFMISVYALMSLGYRDRMSVNTLSFTAVVMLSFNPFALYDVGFQLSFVAVLAIVMLNPPLAAFIPEDILERHRWLRPIWSLTTVSLSAQIGTAPLVAYYFGQLPVYFLLSNYVAIPLVSVVLWLALACVATWWWTALQQLLAAVLSGVVSAMNGLLEWIARLPYSSVDGIHLNTPQLYLIYIVIACLWTLLSLYRQHVEQFAKPRNLL